MTQSISLDRPKSKAPSFTRAAFLSVCAELQPQVQLIASLMNSTKKPKISFAVSLLSRSLYGNHQKGILHFRTPTRGITGAWKQWDHP
jgi:hypothetical protein